MTTELTGTNPHLSTSLTRSLHSASQKHDVSFTYLLKTAERESGLNPAAQAKTSSAAGLFQFIEQTWLGAVKKYGPDHGMAIESAAITQNKNGHFHIQNPDLRDHILKLRLHTDKAANLAAAMTAENRAGLEDKLGRSVRDSDLYAAHFLGLSGAAKLLSANPTEKAASLFPQAAKANASIFFKNGVSKTVAQVLTGFEASFQPPTGNSNSELPPITAHEIALTFNPASQQRLPNLAEPGKTQVSTVNVAQENRVSDKMNISHAKITEPSLTSERVAEKNYLTSTSIASEIGRMSRLSGLSLMALTSLDPTIFTRRGRR